MIVAEALKWVASVKGEILFLLRQAIFLFVFLGILFCVW